MKSFLATAPVRLLILTVGLMFAGCAHGPVNAPLSGSTGGPGYYFRNEPQPGNAEDTLFILAFSGGGTRAAAFAYGVLEGLAETHVRRDGKLHRMLDEVDAITAVSGGSFTAAAFGLQGDKIFETFPDAFLKRNVQANLAWRTLDPLRWPRFCSGRYGRSEMAEEYYDKILFHGATFAALQRPGAPFIIINATDIKAGSRFEFTQDYFDLLCSDLRSFPVSRAVAASSAVPGLLTPITLHNYAGECGYAPPTWMSAQSTNRPGRLRLRAEELGRYLNPTNHPFMHLVDGGVSDNLGLRSLLDALMIIEAEPSLARQQQIQKVKRLVLISANAHSSPENDWDRHESPPNSIAVAAKAASHTLDHFSFETLELIKDVFEKLRGTSGASNGLKLYPIFLNFSEFADPQKQRFFMNLPTSFSLSDNQVDHLRKAGRQLLHQSPEFREFVHDFATPAGKASKP
ncbi:MAG: patatin-like phospholipase family protein [Verrucomicrobia bacterium]|nr:patatin-like phospholipase family protein [Verrucomicrobiota bacterium]